jgi:CubicO group peptidase (beta-lactamase class C family)
VDHPSGQGFAATYGFADRANTTDTGFAIASGVKGLTALTIAKLVEEGRLGFDRTARSLLGPDLPLVDDQVTVEHLLGHLSGIGDYFYEESAYDITDDVLIVPVHELSTTEQYLRLPEGHPQSFASGAWFAYCKSCYVVIELLAEWCSESVPELLQRIVCGPAGMTDTSAVRLGCHDVSVSFRSVHQPGNGITFIVVSNPARVPGHWPGTLLTCSRDNSPAASGR